MCIVIGRYFPEIGWIGVKNRDRNYVPKLNFVRENLDNLERISYIDEMTQYQEGVNDDGVGILSASLMVIDDEKEIKEPGKSHSKDGEKISEALKLSTPEEALKSLIKSGLTGNTIVFNKDKMYLLEACKRGGKYSFKQKEVPQNKIVARTNHGVWLPWAGYQRGKDSNQDKSRASSEQRKKIASYVALNSSSPKEIIDGLCKKYSNNPQMNALRTTHEQKMMRTTAQIMIVPSEKTMYVRPVQSHINFNFWELNNPEADTWVEILSNRALWENLKEEASIPSNMSHSV